MENKVLFETSLGNITIELYPNEAPLSTENFLSYVKKGFFDGVIFHRVIANFMIQGGGFLPGMVQKETDAPIKNEAENGLKNDRGTLSLARTAIVDSATSQFFINLKDNDFLNHKDKSQRGFGYCVFGKVTEGMDVVDKIAKVETGSVGFYDDVPLKDVTIVKASVI